MAALISVVVALATSLLTLAIAVMTKGLFAGHDSLVPVLLSFSAALYVLAIVLGIIQWQRKPGVPSSPPASLPVHHENKQTVSQQQNVYVGGSDPRTIAAEQEKLRHEELVLAALKKAPGGNCLVEPMATHVNLSKPDTRDAFERLYIKKRVRRSSIDAPGDYIYWLDDLER